jgi:peptidoglycan/LPS O-acetylase OafA/YrhL
MRHSNPWLDIVRSAAIALVLLSHSRFFLVGDFPLLDALKFGGFMGVELFFVLSGFLIGKILFSLANNYDYKNIKIFFMRRWLRTLPNYYLFLSITVLVSFLGIRPDPIPNLIDYIFFVQNLFAPHPFFFPEAWSLSVEEVFYFGFPLMAFGLFRFLKLTPQNSMVFLGVLLVFLCSAARVVAAITPEIQWDAGIRKIVIFRLDSIMAGVLFCFFMEKYKWLPKPNYLIYFLVLCFFASSIYVASMSAEELSLSFFAKTALFNMASIGCLGVILIGYQQKIGPRTTAAVGFFSKISYSAYLCNMLVISLINYFFGNISPFIKWIAFFPLVIFIAWLSYTVWEKKFMDYRDKNYLETSAA